MAKILLTPQFVKAVISPIGARKTDYFDTLCKGLLLEVRQTGGKTYYLRFRDFYEKTKHFKIGDERDLTLTQARLLADKARTRVAMGDDPCEAKATAKLIPTFGKFIEDQYLPFVKGYKRSWETDLSLLKNHLLPRFANRRMADICRQDIVKMHHDRKAAGAAPGSANRLLIMMRYIFNLAVRWEVAGVKTNPCANVPLLEENNKHERFLSADEAKRLYETVCASPNKMLQYIVPMLILTGARKRELLDAKWADFDFDRRTWRISMTKTGKARHVPLNDGALQILGLIPCDPECEWLVPNPKTAKPFISIFAAWNTARTLAGLSDVRIHDLRHSFASLLVNQGRTLYEVQHLLGHTQVKTTQRYAHLAQETLLDAVNVAVDALGMAFAPAPCLGVSDGSTTLLAA